MSKIVPMKMTANHPVQARGEALTTKGDTDSEASDPLFVTALSRGLSILRCCANSNPEPTINDVAKRVGLPQATAWRLCHTLIKLGYLERTEHDRLRLGLPVLEFGHAALTKSPLSQLARARLESMARQYKAAVSLGVPDGLEMLYLVRFEGGATLFRGLRVGSHLSILTSAMGWSYLAGLPARERNALLQKIKKAMPGEYARLSRQLHDAMALFRSRRFVINTGVLHPEINALAVNVGPLSAAPVASLSFGGHRSSFPIEMLEKEIGPALLDLADSLTVAVQAGVGTALQG